MSYDAELPPLPASTLLEEIDAQQDDLLRQLDELNDRLELVLRQCAPPGEAKLAPSIALRAA